MIPQKIAIDSNLEFEIQQLKAQRAESSSLDPVVKLSEPNRSEENSLPEKKPYQTARLRLQQFAPHEKCSHGRSLNNTYPPASLIKRASSIEEFLNVGLLTR